MTESKETVKLGKKKFVSNQKHYETISLNDASKSMEVPETIIQALAEGQITAFGNRFSSDDAAELTRSEYLITNPIIDKKTGERRQLTEDEIDAWNKANPDTTENYVQIPQLDWVNAQVDLEQNKSYIRYEYKSHSGDFCYYTDIQIELEEFNTYLYGYNTNKKDDETDRVKKAENITDKVINSLGANKAPIKHAIRFIVKYYVDNEAFPKISLVWDDIKKANFVKGKEANGSIIIFGEDNNEKRYKLSNLQRKNSEIQDEIENLIKN